MLVYTVWLKRSTPQNIVIGGAAGAVPPLVGWAAVTGALSWTALYLFAIVFYWTPPHFWALSLLMKDEYAKAGVPMMPVVRGERETRKQILLYSVLLYAVTQLPFCAGGFDGIYAGRSVVLGAVFIGGAVRAVPPRGPPRRALAVPVLARLPRAAVRGDGGGRADLALDRVVDLVDRRLAGIDSDLLEDRHQRPAEGLERLLGVPDLAHPEVAVDA